MRRRTWKVIAPADFEPDGEELPITCIHCGYEAWLPTHGNPGSMILAVLGMRIVFDQPGNIPPPGWWPDVIQCRKCRRVYGQEQESGPQEMKVAS